MRTTSFACVSALIAALCWPMDEARAQEGDRGVAGFGGTGVVSGKPGMALELGDVQVSGALSAAQLREEIKRLESPLRVCYVHELNERPDSSGVLALKWKIKASGEVGAALVASSTLEHTSVERCMVEAVKRARFRGASADTRVAMAVSLLPGLGTIGGKDPSLGVLRHRGGPLRSGPVMPERVAHVELRSPVVRGTLTREIVERIARQRRNEIKFCYEQELRKAPQLAGTITIKFAIAPSGAVVSTAVAESTLKAPELERCVKQRILRWMFPAPSGGVVMVAYPLRLSLKPGR